MTYLKTGIRPQASKQSVAALKLIVFDMTEAIKDVRVYESFCKQKSLSVKYMTEGYLTPDDKVSFGFIDPGRIGKKTYGVWPCWGKYWPADQGREILYVGPPHKCTFKRLSNELESLKRKGKSWEDQIRHLSLRIHRKTGGNDDGYNWEGMVSVFNVRNGCCRHVSLMFKWACDTLGYSCCLIRGDVISDINEGAHIWNVVVSPSGKVYVIDVLNAPLDLYTEDDVKTGVDKIHLSRRDGLKFIQKFRRIGGGIGHSVIRDGKS